MRPARLLLTVGVLMLLAGCASTGGLSQAERDAAITDAMSTDLTEDASAGDIPPLPDAADALLTPEPLNASHGPRLEPPRFDITADDVSVANFYHGLVEDTPYNVIVHPDITGSVSLKLSDVSVPEVMEILRGGYGYHYRRTDGSYLILPSSLETRVFSLNYINVQREGVSGTSISGGEIKSSDETNESDNDQMNGSNLTTRSNSQIWNDVESAIKEIITGQAQDGDTQESDTEQDGPDTGDSARVVTSPEAGSIVVRATPESLEQVETFIAGLQDTVNRQVILEARILEVTLSDRFEAGIDWNVLSRVNLGDFDADLIDNQLLTESQRDGSEYNPANDTEVDISLTPPTDIGDAFELGILRNGSFDVTIDALEQQGDVMVLSSPRVSTLNNQKALIKVGTDTFFQTGVDLETTTEDGALFTSIDPEFRSFFSGISLDVTPSIDASGSVTMHVQPSVSQVTDVPRTVQTGEGGTITFDLASSDVRQSDSIVRAEDGDLIIIGGLMEQREESSKSAVPGIGQIPPFDLLFGRERNVSRKVELVILLRPTIVGDDTWRREIDRQLEQML